MHSRPRRKRYCGQTSARKFLFCDHGKVFSHATDAKDFGIKGLWGYGVMGFISGRATSPFVASLNFEISKIH